MKRNSERFTKKQTNKWHASMNRCDCDLMPNDYLLINLDQIWQCVSKCVSLALQYSRPLMVIFNMQALVYCTMYVCSRNRLLVTSFLENVMYLDHQLCRWSIGLDRGHSMRVQRDENWIRGDSVPGAYLKRSRYFLCMWAVQPWCWLVNDVVNHINCHDIIPISKLIKLFPSQSSHSRGWPFVIRRGLTSQQQCLDACPRQCSTVTRDAAGCIRRRTPCRGTMLYFVHKKRTTQWCSIVCMPCQLLSMPVCHQGDGEIFLTPRQSRVKVFRVCHWGHRAVSLLALLGDCRSIEHGAGSWGV